MPPQFRTIVGWEHTHREMLPAIILLHRLAKRGIPADLTHVLAMGKSKEQRLAMLPFYYDDRDLQRYLYRGGVANSWVVNLAYEQMHLECGRPYLLPDGQFAKESMLHCAWGPRFRDLLVDHGIPPEHIRLTGHLRFDIYHHRSLLMSREALATRFGLDPDKPWLLIPGSFNLAYITETLRADLLQRGYEIGDDLIEVTRQTRDHFLKLLDTVSAACPDVEVILRVHPAGYESEAVYAGPASDRPNLHVVASFDLANWIVQSALVVVWNSTSAMEALVAGVPVVAFEPEPYTDVFDYDVGRIVPRLTTESDVVDLVRALPGDLNLDYDWELFEQWYAHRDGKNTARLADVAVEAQQDFDAFQIRSDDAFGKGLGLRRSTALAADMVPNAVKKSWKKMFGGATPHASPEPAVLAEAVETLSSAPLGDYLK